MNEWVNIINCFFFFYPYTSLELSIEELKSHIKSGSPCTWNLVYGTEVLDSGDLSSNLDCILYYASLLGHGKSQLIPPSLFLHVYYGDYNVWLINLPQRVGLYNWDFECQSAYKLQRALQMCVTIFFKVDTIASTIKWGFHIQRRLSPRWRISVLLQVRYLGVSASALNK